MHFAKVFEQIFINQLIHFYLRIWKVIDIDISIYCLQLFDCQKPWKSKQRRSPFVQIKHLQNKKCSTAFVIRPLRLFIEFKSKQVFINLIFVKMWHQKEIIFICLYYRYQFGAMWECILFWLLLKWKFQTLYDLWNLFIYLFKTLFSPAKHAKRLNRLQLIKESSFPVTRFLLRLTSFGYVVVWI